MSIRKKTAIGIPIAFVLYLAKGIWEQWFFGYVTQLLGYLRVGMDTVVWIEKYQDLIVVTVTVIAIIVIALWTVLDIRHKSKLLSVLPILRRIDKQLTKIALEIEPILPDFTNLGA